MTLFSGRDRGLVGRHEHICIYYIGVHVYITVEYVTDVCITYICYSSMLYMYIVDVYRDICEQYSSMYT